MSACAQSAVSVYANVFVDIKPTVQHIELPAKLLDYFLRSNKSNINQTYTFAHAWCSKTPVCMHTTLSAKMHMQPSSPFGMHVSIPDCWDPENRRDSDVKVRAFARRARRLQHPIPKVAVRRRWPCFCSLIDGAVRQPSH